LIKVHIIEEEVEEEGSGKQLSQKRGNRIWKGLGSVAGRKMSKGN
jgi:hypothetical protein